MRTSILAVLASASLMACAATVPRPQPIDAQSAGLGMKLRMREKLGPLVTESHLYARTVLFVRFDEGEDLDDLASKQTLIPSTFVDYDHVYLLNVIPGTYAAVAAVYGSYSEPIDAEISFNVGSSATVGFQLPGLEGGEVIIRNYFSRKMIAETLTTVKAGSFGFMGEYVADQSFRFGDEADEAQRHFLHVLEGPDVDRTGLVSDLSSGGRAVRLSIEEMKHDAEAQRDFAKQARKHLKETAWVPMLEPLITSE